MKEPDCPTVHLSPGHGLELRVPKAQEEAREQTAALFARLALASGWVIWPTVRWVEGKKSVSVFAELAPLSG